MVVGFSVVVSIVLMMTGRMPCCNGCCWAGFEQRSDAVVVNVKDVDGAVTRAIVEAAMADGSTITSVSVTGGTCSFCMSAKLLSIVTLCCSR